MSGSNSVILDTNIIIDIFNGDKVVAKEVSNFQKIIITPIILGEIYTGINRVKDKKKHQQKLDAFLEWCVIIPIYKTTAKYFGKIVAQLYEKGKPIPTNDVWIAASAIENDLPLMTKDKHFEEISGLKLFEY